MTLQMAMAENTLYRVCVTHSHVCKFVLITDAQILYKIDLFFDSFAALCPFVRCFKQYMMHLLLISHSLRTVCMTTFIVRFSTFLEIDTYRVTKHFIYAHITQFLMLFKAKLYSKFRFSMLALLTKLFSTLTFSHKIWLGAFSATLCNI